MYNKTCMGQIYGGLAYKEDDLTMDKILKPDELF